MITSDPAGATISVNGRRLPQTTPAQISLAPGNYSITVEKDGKQATSPAEIREGALNYTHIVLNQPAE